MFTVLNRLRGTWSWFAKVAGIVLGISVYVFTRDIHVSILVTIMYVLGESMGWGKWIGGIMNGNHGPTTLQEMEDKEGERNGIHAIASFIIPPESNYFLYCIIALTIRGFYWWGLTLLPIVVFGYIDISMYFVSSLLLSIGFPISVLIGKETSKLFGFSDLHFGMIGTWEHGEVWYGLMQDIILISLIMNAV